MAENLAVLEPALIDEIDEEGRHSNPEAPLLAIGGTRAVAAVVDEFYRRLLADPVTAGAFQDVDMSRLKRHQVLLLVKVLGGPDRYTGRDLASAHAGMGITAELYARVCLHLLTVLHDFKVPMDILVAANQVLTEVRPQIVTAPGADQPAP